MNFDEFIADVNQRRGRKRGSASRNRFDIVYRTMKQKRLLRGADRKTLKEVVNRVGDGIWKKVYKGHIVAVPGLFNMEVRPNTVMWGRRVDWKRTMKLWSEDKDAFKERLLIRARTTRYLLSIKRSTIGLQRRWWYYSLMLDVRPCLGKVRQIEDKYEL